MGQVFIMGKSEDYFIAFLLNATFEMLIYQIFTKSVFHYEDRAMWHISKPQELGYLKFFNDGTHESQFSHLMVDSIGDDGGGVVVSQKINECISKPHVLPLHVDSGSKKGRRGIWRIKLEK